MAVIGDFAFVPRYQGAGSSMVNPTKVETVSEMISAYAEKFNPRNAELKRRPAIGFCA